jgi:hypothetical protein
MRKKPAGTRRHTESQNDRDMEKRIRLTAKPALE